MKNFILFGNTGCSNRGCEAIIKSTVLILQDYSLDISLATFNLKDDFKCCNSINVNPIEIKTKKTLLYYFESFVSRIKPLYFVGKKKKYIGIFDASNNDTVFLTIGGDTYCYGFFSSFFAFSHFTKKYKKPNILWCCSVNKDCISGIKKRSLLNYDFIFVREQISYNNLINSKFPKEKLIKVCDPAFFLPKKEITLPTCFEKETVGINISPIVYNSKNENAVKAIDKLVKYILSNTSYNICLIPHVYKINEKNNDLSIHREIFNKLKSQSKRITLIDNAYDCEELKYVISKCKIVVAARTHASIAAYSSLVPTLVIGYSVKSKGIALDLFGTTENFVIDYKNIKEDNELISAFNYIDFNCTKIKEKLSIVIPSYKSLLTNALDKFFCKQPKRLCNPNYCVGCGVCSTLCESNAINLKMSEKGFLVPIIDNTKCSSCGLCYKKCPINNKLQTQICIKKNAIAQTKNKEVLFNSSSGGVFYSLVDYVTSQNGYVFACKLNSSLQAEHFCFNKLEDITPFQGSKYIQSKIASILPKLKELLEQNILCLFVGTPCQIVAVKTYLRKEYSNLILIDLICHGVPSYNLFNSYLENREKEIDEKITSINFRYKNNQKYGMLLNRKHFYNSSNDVFMRLFICNNYLRPSCFSCKYKGLNRESDITIGDCWNESPNSFDKSFGGSIIYINSNKGDFIFDKIKKDLFFEECFNSKIIDQISYSCSPTKPLKFNKYLLAVNDKNIVKMYKMSCSSNVFYRAIRFIRKYIF